DRLPNGNQIYVIQVQDGRAAAAVQLLPGETTTGLEITDEAYDQSGCLHSFTCVSTSTYVLVVPYGPNTFPTDLLTPGTTYPGNGDDPALDNDIHQDRVVYRKEDCIVSIVV